LRTRWLGRAFRHLDTCRSTNDEAAAWARAGAPHGALVIADEQTAGRGRLGRAWHSPRGENLYFSTVLRPDLPPHRAPPLTLAAPLAPHLERACDRFFSDGADPIVAAWKRRARLFGRRVTVASGHDTITGVAEDLDTDGTLLVRRDDGALTRIIAGEIAKIT